MLWNNFKANSPWKQLEHTAEEWDLLYPEPHPLFKLPHVSVMNVAVGETPCHPPRDICLHVWQRLVNVLLPDAAKKP